MNTTFRLVHFVPDPYSGGRWPVAAIIERDGTLEVVRATVMPGSACVGGPQAYAACELVMQSLRHVVAPDRMPAEVGTCVELGPRTAVPAGIADPAAWLRDAILPSREPAKSEEGHPRPPRRTRYGEQFLRRWEVDRFVRPRFIAAEHVPELRTEVGDRLPNVSQWVKGRTELLLLEPLAPVRLDVVDEARRVWQEFASYAYAFEHGHVDPPRPRMLAYVLGGGDRDLRAGAISAVVSDSWSVVDTENDMDRDRFLQLIRETGQSLVPSSPTLFS